VLGNTLGVVATKCHTATTFPLLWLLMEKYTKNKKKKQKNEIKMACYPIFFANFAEARKSLADSIMK